jgi:uncharacterized protein YecE (DUF72 family)
MATRLHIAAKDLQGDIRAYAKRFSYLEVQLDTPKTPSLVTMRRWRKAVGPTFEFGVVAGPELACPRPGADLEAGIAKLSAAVNALGARCILLQTGIDVTPTALWRERLLALIAQLPNDASRIAWEPRGVWEPEVAAKFAAKAKLTLVYNPVRESINSGNAAYVRLRALGETRSYGSAALAQVAEAICNTADAYVVIETNKPLDEAKRLRRAMQEVGSTAGTSRIVRPRVTTFRVGDDEQE